MLAQQSNHYYLNHIAVLNDKNTATLSEDVLNQHGVLVAKKGTQVNQRAADVLAKHKLAKPLDHSFKLADCLGKQLTLGYFEKHNLHFYIAQFMNNNELFKEGNLPFNVLSRYQLIDQKLTVMSSQLQYEFDRTILSATIALGISQKLGLGEDESKTIFIATLLSDTGLLHLPPNIVSKQGEYASNEWRMMKAHMVIAKYFSDLVPLLPRVVGKAILEHHERPDGFGYPFGKKADSLGIEGQIIAISDTIVSLYRKLVVKGHYSWNGVASVIQVPTSAHSDTVRNAALLLLKSMKIPEKNTYKKEQFSPLILTLKSKHQRLNNWFDVLSALLKLHHKELSESDSFRPYALLMQLSRTIVNSGLLSDVQLAWLDEIELPPSEPDRLDIEEYELKLNEIEYQCFFVMKKLQEDFKEFSSRFNSAELAKHYNEELLGILQDD
jgi:HD-GYP domain-containing protein (c-di-GMP phosphodiesterase class II)